MNKKIYLIVNRKDDIVWNVFDYMYKEFVNGKM